MVFLNIFTGINYSNYSENTNNQIDDKNIDDPLKDITSLHTADYSESFQSTGGEINVSFHQSITKEENPVYEIANVSDTTNNTFSIDCPNDATFKSTTSQIFVKNIFAPNRTLSLENDTDDSKNCVQSWRAFSFNVPGDGVLENLTLYIRNNHASNDAQVNIDLMSATSGGLPDLVRQNLATNYLLENNTQGFHNFTNLGKSFQTSQTYNNKWFIRVIRNGGSGYVELHGKNDNVAGGEPDDSDAYYYFDSHWNNPDSIDYYADIGLAPPNNVPTPSQIGLEINSTQVGGSTQGSGDVTIYRDFSSLPSQLDYEITADWWDISCNISKIQTNFTKNDLKIQSTIYVQNSGDPILWNVTKSGGFNYFDSDFGNYYINFTIPTKWENVGVFNGSTPKTNNVTRDLNNGYEEIQIFEAGNGTYWYLNASSDNLLHSIDIYDINGILISMANYSDTVSINASFSSILDYSKGNAQIVNLSIYSPEEISSYLNYTNTNQTNYNSNEIDLGDWTISSTVQQYGIFRVQVWWNNDTDVGYNQTELLILGETETVVSIPKNEFDVTEEFNITITFNDKEKIQPINGADIIYSLNGTGWRNDHISPLGNGEYNITIDCGDSDFNGYGQKTIIIKTNKTYYNNQTDTVEIFIGAPTDLKFINNVGKANYLSNEIFNITVHYNDTEQNLGINGADINYTLDGNTWRYDNVHNFGEGYYNITVYCNDNDFGVYGSFIITINASEYTYDNKSVDTSQFSITGLSNLGQYAPAPTMNYSTQTFNLSMQFYDISRGNQGINGANISVDVEDTDITSNVQVWNHGDGYYDIKIDGGLSVFSNYGSFSIRVNASKINYDNDTLSIEVFIAGNTTLTVLSPLENAEIVVGTVFDIKIEFEDMVRPSQFIADADINYTLDGGTTWRYENVTYNGGSTYNITIWISHSDFGSNYGSVDIYINASKYKYVNRTMTKLTIQRQIPTTITPSTTKNFGSVFRGENRTYEFNYTDNSNTPIPGATITIESSDQGFIWDWNDEGEGNYTISINSTYVQAKVQEYILLFKISLSGNQSWVITVRIVVLLPKTSITNFESNIVDDIVPEGFNLIINFTFMDAFKDQVINTIDYRNITVWDVDNDINWTRGFGYILINHLNGNYTLNISTSGLIRGNQYTILINITYTSPNPGPYNYTSRTIPFYYASKTVPIPPSDGGGGGGGGGVTTVTGIALESLMLYFIIIGAVVGLVGAIVGIQKGVIAPKKREKERILREVTTVFDDAINLEHLLVIFKGTGTCIFFKSYGMEEIDPELISGFLTAVSSFGREMDSQEALNEIKYGDKMLLLADGKFIRVALVLEKSASIILRQHLKEFIEGFEGAYANELPKWRGQINVFRDAGDLVDEKLHTSIILPHEIKYDLGKVKALKNPHSKDVLKVANSLVAESDRKFFFIATLLIEAVDKTRKDKAEIFMGIKELRDSGLLSAIQLKTIEEQPVSQQELNLIRQKLQEIPGLADAERQKLINDVARMSPAEREAYIASLEQQEEIVSAPIKSKAGEIVIDNIKSAKKEVKNLRNKARSEIKMKNIEKGIGIYRQASLIATNWDLTKEFEVIEDEVRIITIKDLRSKMKVLEAEAKLAAKAGDYAEASEKYSIASDAASEIFKLGITEMTKEVKRLTNKSKEFERLS